MARTGRAQTLRVAYRYLRRYYWYRLMPINPQRHGADWEDLTGEKPERLPGDTGGDIDWVCQHCANPQFGRPERGCPTCGAGTPGHKAEKKQPTYEELQGSGMVGPEVAGKPDYLVKQTHHVTLNLADRLSKVGGLTPESLRQIIREELSEALKPPTSSFSDKERLAILEGLGMVVAVLETPDAIHPQQAALLPSVDEIKALTVKLQEE